MPETRAWLRIKKAIEAYEENPLPLSSLRRVSALRENPTGDQMAARKKTAKRRSKSTRRKSSSPKRRRKTARKKTSRKKRATRRSRPRVTAMIPVTAAAPRKRRRTKRRKPRRRARRGGSRTTVKVVRVTCQPRVVGRTGRKSTRRRRSGGRRRRRMLENPIEMTSLPMATGTEYLSNPALFENQAGPFSGGALRALGAVSVGVGIGFTIAELTDRFVATRGNKEPWYGRDAAAYHASRPDAMRLGVQAAGAVGGLALSYAVRGRGVLTFLASGIAIGFGVNLVRMGLNYYLMPAVLKVENFADKNLGNRLYPLEQQSVQEQVTKYLQAKNEGQTAEQTPVSPLTPVTTPATGVAYLGKGGNGAANGSALGKAHEASVSNGNGLGAAQQIVATGRLGTCSSCGGNGGCYKGCSTLKLCPDCPSGNVAMTCEYVVQEGDDLTALATAADVDIALIQAMNDGDFWQPGNTVTMPYAMCVYLQHGTVYGIGALGGAEDYTPVSEFVNMPHIERHPLLDQPDHSRALDEKVAASLFASTPEG